MGGQIARRSRWETGLIAMWQIEDAARIGRLRFQIQMSSMNVRLGRELLMGLALVPGRLGSPGGCRSWDGLVGVYLCITVGCTDLIIW